MTTKRELLAADQPHPYNCHICGKRVQPDHFSNTPDGWWVNIYAKSYKQGDPVYVQPAEVCSIKCLHKFIDLLEY
jgi:hypothetical protein